METMDFIAFVTDAGRGLAKPGRRPRRRPGPPYIRLQSALRLRPRRAVSSAEAVNMVEGKAAFGKPNSHQEKLKTLNS